MGDSAAPSTPFTQGDAADGHAPALARMTGTLSRRGPDDAGSWLDARENVALGHRRLSIVDLSPCGHQPMTAHGGRYVIVFNGEVYNFDALRQQLPADYPYRGHSDTEVMLAAFEHWGIEAAIERFVGMFAFALWDRESQTLTLARDRLGIKPLYYGESNGTFLFGSELKALRAHPAFDAALDRAAIGEFLRLSYIPAPYSVYRSARKLAPGHILQVRRTAEGFATETRAFWTLHDVVEAGQAARFSGTDAEALDGLDAVLRDAVRLRMIADVPLGAFLSGGVDSSLVVALMQQQSAQPVRTFSIGFTDARYDEAPHARAVASHLGTDHTEHYVSEADVLGIVPQLPSLYDEPFADSSQIPTTLVSALAREHVTVILSGDGGDELFGGYNRYLAVPRLWAAVSRWPLGLRVAVANGLERLANAREGSVVERLMGVLPQRDQIRMPAEKLAKLARLLRAPTLDAVYERLVSTWPDAAQALATPAHPAAAFAEPPGLTPLERMMYLDALTYLPDDILTKVDRASMAASLEARVPLLDHRVVAFAWTLPAHLRIRNGQSKWLLRHLLYRHVPPALIERPKMGFGIPIGELLRGPLRTWAENLLRPDRLRADGLLNADVVQARWHEHLSGRRNWEHALWNVLMLNAWLDAQT